MAQNVGSYFLVSFDLDDDMPYLTDIPYFMEARFDSLQEAESVADGYLNMLAYEANDRREFIFQGASNANQDVIDDYIGLYFVVCFDRNDSLPHFEGGHFMSLSQAESWLAAHADDLSRDYWNMQIYEMDSQNNFLLVFA